MRRQNPERAIASAVVDFFLSEPGDPAIYHEVTHPDGKRRTDLVVTRGGIVHIVECKTELSFELLAQAWHWTTYGIVWLAIPKLHRHSEGRAEAIRIARSSLYGFGVFVVDDRARVVAMPDIREPADPRLAVSLRPEHQTYAHGGSPSGGHFTSFKASCAALAEYVKQNDACTIEDAVRAIPHHYASNASAAKALFHWAREGKVEGVHIGWKGRLYNSPRASAQSMRRSA